MDTSHIKTCLVITYGPVPTPQYQTVEGGGMRAWGLAKGLVANNVKVTVAVNDSFPQELKDHENITLTNWSLNQQFADLINSYDAVLVSYCMGDPSIFIVDNINNNVQLILDAYVPIYVEVSARESNDLNFEYRHYMSDVQNYNYVLKRGDYFLCANDMQKTFYTGVLSGLGIINPRSYRQERILVVPFGIHDVPIKTTYNPYTKLGFKKSDFVVLWFGGLYPWFKIQDLLDAILELSKIKNLKFVVVGGKNPFNSNPDFIKQYETAFKFAKGHKLLDNSLFFIDWVDFEDRINWYGHADIVISINKPGEENSFAWRTRVMDYVWGEMAILTNGGDPLSEELLEKQAALRLDELSAKEIVKKITQLHDQPDQLTQIAWAVKSVKPKYFWHSVTRPIAKVLESGEKPYIDEQRFRKKLKIDIDTLNKKRLNPKIEKAYKVAGLPRRVVSYARRKGLKRSAGLAFGIAVNQAKNQLNKNQPKFVFISHPIDHTGGAVVVLDIIREFVEKYGPSRVRLITPHITPTQLRDLREMGVKVDKSAQALGARLISLQLGLGKDDFVLMNTVAIYDNYRDYIFGLLNSGKLKKAYWFIHEDKDQLPRINRDFLNKTNLRKLARLVKNKKLTLLVPTKRTKQEYDDILDTTQVKIIHERVNIDDKYKIKRPAKDFDKINFFITGTPDDGRKGQLIAISALYKFLATYQKSNPEKYRDFSLHLISLRDDYISQQIRWIGNSLLGKRLKTHPQMPYDDVLKLYSKCNAVICCSLNETFGLYVAEGMFMGHVVLRNNSAGVDEQLKDGKNGYLIDHTNLDQFSKVIENMLNKGVTSNEKLRKMGEESKKIINPYKDNRYLNFFDLDK